MELFDAYIEAMAFSLIVILSYLFSYISAKTKVPSILLLIGLGVGAQALIVKYEVDLTLYIKEVINLLGIVGLIIIILEATLELKIKKEKKGLLIWSFIMAFLSLLLTTSGIASLLYFFIIQDVVKALFYAIPLAIISSEIVIPGVSGLLSQKKEYLIYESAFSGIIGIMFFYILLGSMSQDGATRIVLGISGNIVATLIISLVISYALVWMLQWLKLNIKLFFLIAILVFLYALGEMFHLSALLIILVFGLILNNYTIFFRGRLRGLIKKDLLENITEDFRLVTNETSFLVKTFYFFIFGMTLNFKNIYNLNVIYIVAGSLIVIYVIRYILLKSIERKQITPQVWIAPRGFISVLLFFSIPALWSDPAFDSTILLIILLATGLVMVTGMISNKEEIHEADELSFEDWDQLDREIKALTIDEKDLRK